MAQNGGGREIGEGQHYRPANGYLAFLVTRCDRELARHVEAHLTSVDLTEAQFGVLQALMKLRRASSATLARTVGVTPQAMVGLITALERKGYITREPRHGGGRVIDAEVTPAGRSAFETARRRIRVLDRAVRAALTDDEHDHLTTLLERLPSVLDQVDGPRARHHRRATRAS
jgi:DNA-binding MarR family transcriptional regulator